MGGDIVLRLVRSPRDGEEGLVLWARRPLEVVGGEDATLVVPSAARPLFRLVRSTRGYIAVRSATGGGLSVDGGRVLFSFLRERSLVEAEGYSFEVCGLASFSGSLKGEEPLVCNRSLHPVACPGVSRFMRGAEEARTVRGFLILAAWRNDVESCASCIAGGLRTLEIRLFEHGAFRVEVPSCSWAVFWPRRCGSPLPPLREWVREWEGAVLLERLCLVVLSGVFGIGAARGVPPVVLDPVAVPSAARDWSGGLKWSRQALEEAMLLASGRARGGGGT